MSNSQVNPARIITALFAAMLTATSAAPVAQADICSRNPGEPLFIKVTNLGNGFVRLDSCLRADPSRCVAIGGRYFHIHELKGIARTATNHAIEEGAVEVLAGGAFAGTVAGMAIGGGAGAAVMSLFLASLSATAVFSPGMAMIGEWNETINPFELAHKSTTFKALTLEVGTGKCVYLKDNRSIGQLADYLGGELNRTALGKEVVSSEQAKQAYVSIPGLRDDKFLPFNDIQGGKTN